MNLYVLLNYCNIKYNIIIKNNILQYFIRGGLYLISKMICEYLLYIIFFK